MARLDSKKEAAGAEFLVLGHLLIEGIEAHKTYTNFPGYDIVAVNPDADRVCRIQVKSRWATNHGGGFLIKNFDCDFVVFVALNRGFASRKSNHALESGKGEPEFFVIPSAVAEQASSEKSSWGKAFLRNMSEPEQYRDNWMLIATFLSVESG
jgi:hypothetical protein